MSRLRSLTKLRREATWAHPSLVRNSTSVATRYTATKQPCEPIRSRRCARCLRRPSSWEWDATAASNDQPRLPNASRAKTLCRATCSGVPATACRCSTRSSPMGSKRSAPSWFCWPLQVQASRASRRPSPAPAGSGRLFQRRGRALGAPGTQRLASRRAGGSGSAQKNFGPVRKYGIYAVVSKYSVGHSAARAKDRQKADSCSNQGYLF